MKRLLAEARGAFDWVILDTPPVMLLPDAHLMASIVDGAVLVVRARLHAVTNWSGAPAKPSAGPGSWASC
jgi:hypothetical protein